MGKTENKQQNDSSPFVSSDFNIDGVTSPVKKRHSKKDQGEKGNVSSSANYKRLIQFFSTKRLKVREQKNILHRKKLYLQRLTKRKLGDYTSTRKNRLSDKNYYKIQRILYINDGKFSLSRRNNNYKHICTLHPITKLQNI